MSQIGTITRHVQTPSGNVTNAGFTEEATFEVPPHGLIRRIRVQKIAGPAANVEAEIRKTVGGTGFDVLAAVALAAEIDRGGLGDIIEVPYLVDSLPRAGLPDGNMIVALKSDNAGASTYRIELHIEAR